MASKSSKAIPFIVLTMIGGVLTAEVVLDIQIDIEAWIPVLSAMGVAGPALSGFKKFAAARASIPKEVEDAYKDAVRRKIEQI